ncbi:tetratricopeptide repeat protein [Lysobacter humi (ex Lee et al. 2017)]
MRLLVPSLLLASLLAPDATAAPPAPYPAPYAAVLHAPADPLAYHADFALARQALDARRWSEAAERFARLVEAYPLDRESWTGLGTARRQLGDAAGSIAAYERSIALIGPTPGSARYWIAAQQAALGQHDAAIETLRHLIEEDRDLDRPGLLADPAFAALRTHPRWTALDAPVPVATEDRVAGWRGDLDWLLAEIRRLAPAYRDAPLPAATREAAERLRADIPRLSDDAVYARLGELVATLGLGHTLLWGATPDGPLPGARLRYGWMPVQLYAFPDGLHVVQADPAHAGLVGRRLVAVDGVPAATVLQRVLGTISHASPAEGVWTAPMRLTDMTLLHGLGIARDPRRVTLTLADAAGRATDVTLDAATAPRRPRLPAAPGVAPPAWLARTGESHWLEDWPGLSTTYVQFNQVAPDPDEDLAAFGLRLRKHLASNGARNVVVDLRHNNGGNTFTYTELLRTLVAHSAGDGRRVYALIGRNVYSAAANFSTDLERLAKPVFVGEPTGMTGNQDGDEARIVLPWSRAAATVSGVRWQLSHPWDRRGSIAPHVPVVLTADDWRAGRDPVVETVRALIAREASTTASR